MFNNKTVSVVMSTHNEKDSIRQCIEDFFSTGYVDEVIIVDNHAVDGTVDEVRKTKARLIFEPKQGYGYGFRTALAAASGDLIIMCEPDGTFCPSDLIKFLAYSDSFEVVQGSRTYSTMILDGANMGLFLKYGNYIVAKLAQILFFTTSPSLSDCGCTFRLLSRGAHNRLRPHFKQGGSAFGLEIMLLTLRMGLKVCQIPVHYQGRVGVSSVTGSFRKALILGLHMIALIFYHFITEKFSSIRNK